MKQTETKFVKLEPEQGMYLTQTDEAIELKDRVVATLVIVPEGTDLAMYREIDAAEAQAIKDAKRELMEQAMKAKQAMTMN